MLGGINLVAIWELVKMVGIITLIVALFIGVAIGAAKEGVVVDKVSIPWSKQERKAEKRRQREQAKIRKREMRGVYVR